MADYATKYPRWTLTVQRSNGPFLVGSCGCGWTSGDHLRTVVIADEWDRHMLKSKPADHMEQAPEPESRGEQLDAERRGEGWWVGENCDQWAPRGSIAYAAAMAELRAEKRDELMHENVD